MRGRVVQLRQSIEAAEAGDFEPLIAFHARHGRLFELWARSDARDISELLIRIDAALKDRLPLELAELKADLDDEEAGKLQLRLKSMQKLCLLATGVLRTRFVAELSQEISQRLSGSFHGFGHLIKVMALLTGEHSVADFSQFYEKFLEALSLNVPSVSELSLCWLEIEQIGREGARRGLPMASFYELVGDLDIRTRLEGLRALDLVHVENTKSALQQLKAQILKAVAPLEVHPAGLYIAAQAGPLLSVCYARIEEIFLHEAESVVGLQDFGAPISTEKEHILAKIVETLQNQLPEKILAGLKNFRLVVNELQWILDYMMFAKAKEEANSVPGDRFALLGCYLKEKAKAGEEDYATYLGKLRAEVAAATQKLPSFIDKVLFAMGCLLFKYIPARMHVAEITSFVQPQLLNTVRNIHLELDFLTEGPFPACHALAVELMRLWRPKKEARAADLPDVYEI